jgi:hypothetical protein
VCSDKGFCEKPAIKVYTCKADCECPSGMKCGTDGYCK